MTAVRAATGLSQVRPAAGTLRRRRSLPNTRAVLGALLVIVAVVGVFATWLEAGTPPGQHYVVARHGLTPGSELRPGDLALATMTLPAPNAAHAFRSVDALVGRVVAAPVGAGDLVPASAVLGSAQRFGQRQVSLVIDVTEAVALQVGQPVDVLVTHGNGDAARTDLVVAGAQLLRITRLDTSLGDRAGSVATVGVGSFLEVQLLVHAVRTGQIDVVAGSVSDRSPAAPSLPGPAPASTAP